MESGMDGPLSAMHWPQLAWAAGAHCG